MKWPILDTLATRWPTAHAQPSRGPLLLPTRGAARSLAEAFGCSRTLAAGALATTIVYDGGIAD